MDNEILIRYKKSFKNSVFFATLILLVLGVYAGAYSKSESLGVLETLAGLMDYIIANPLKIYPVDWFYPFMFAIVASVADLYLYYEYIRRKNSMPDKEHGTSKFNDNIQKFRREFVYDPKICVKKKCLRQRLWHLFWGILSFLPYFTEKELEDEDWDEEEPIEIEQQEEEEEE